MTQLDLITEAMQDIGAVSAGELPAPDEVQTCASKLAGLIESLNANRTAIFSVRADIYNLTTAGTYAIGPTAADFQTERPARIESANIVQAGIRYPLDLFNVDQWAAIQYRAVTDSIPNILYCDYAFPNANLNLYGAPIAGLQLELFTWQKFAQLAALDSPIFYPDGYREALLYNLEARIWPSFHGSDPISPVIVELARNSMADVMRMNLPDLTIYPDQAVRGEIQAGVFNIVTGGYLR